MMPSLTVLKQITDLPVKVWVLAPHLQGNDAHIDYYYDFSQSIAEYEKTFAALDIEWVWQPVTMGVIDDVLTSIAVERAEGKVFPVVLNICDGDEVNGTPGISVVRGLVQRGLLFTGSDEYFYRITTSKIPMKRAFDCSGVSTPPWLELPEGEIDAAGVFNTLSVPVMVKPSVSGGSMGIGVKNVVYTEQELQQLVGSMRAGYREWDLASGGLIAESFINGPEYTVLIVGDFDRPDTAQIYTPVQRVFHSSLPENQQFLSFDRLWEIYEEESPMPDNGNFYEYERPPEKLIGEICRISWAAFVSNRGRGYARIDVRQDKQSGRLYVLEVNAQCGLSEDEDFTSIGAILRISGKTFVQLVEEIIGNAAERHLAEIGNKRRKQLVPQKQKPEHTRAKMLNHAGRPESGK